MAPGAKLHGGKTQGGEREDALVHSKLGVENEIEARLGDALSQRIEPILVEEEMVGALREPVAHRVAPWSKLDQAELHTSAS